MIKKTLAVMSAILLFSLVAWGATAGDPLPFGKYGRLNIKAYDASTVVFDGGTGSIVIVPAFPSQNAIALYNNGANDGGTSAAVYCGFDVNVKPTTGFKIPVGSSLSVDIVASTSAAVPRLYCTGDNTTWVEQDVRWMVVK